MVDLKKSNRLAGQITKLAGFLTSAEKEKIIDIYRGYKSNAPVREIELLKKLLPKAQKRFDSWKSKKETALNNTRKTKLSVEGTRIASLRGYLLNNTKMGFISPSECLEFWKRAEKAKSYQQKKEILMNAFYLGGARKKIADEKEMKSRKRQYIQTGKITKTRTIY